MKHLSTLLRATAGLASVVLTVALVSAVVTGMTYEPAALHAATPSPGIGQSYAS